MIGKSDLKGFFTYTIASLITSAIPFLLLPILTRVLETEEYGQIALFQAVMVALSPFIGLSVHGAISIEYFKGCHSTFSKFVGNCIIILFSTFSIVFAITYLLSSQVEDIFGLDVFYVLVAILSVACQFVINIRLTIWQSKKLSFSYAKFQILQAITNVILTLTLVISIPLADKGRIISISAALVIFAMLALHSLLKEKLIKFSFSSELIKKALSWGVPLIPHVAGTAIIAIADRFVIEKNLGPESLGVFFVALQLSMPIALIGASFNKAFQPWLFNSLSKSQTVEAVIVSYISMLSLCLIGILYWIVAIFLFPLIIKAPYEEALIIMSYLIFGSLFQALYYTVGNYLLYENRTGILSVASSMAGFLYITLCLLFIGSHGLLGISLIYFITQALFFILVWLLSAYFNKNIYWFSYGNLLKVCKEYSKLLVNAKGD